MAPGDPKREAELAIARLRTRKEMRSAGDEEDSTVIEKEAITRRGKSVPAPARGLVAVLDKLPPWGRVIVLLALIALVASGAGAKLAGWF
jgi:hypothetical protein